MTVLAERPVNTTQKEFVVYAPTIELYPVQHTQETLQKWTAWLQNPDVHLWMSGDIPKTAGEVNEWLYNATHDPRRHYFTIMADGNMIGIINLRLDHMPDKTGEIGIVIGEPEYRGLGIGKQAVEKVLTHARDVVHLSSVRAHIKPENEKSIHLFTGQGFIHTMDVTIDRVPFQRFEKRLR